MLINNKNRYFDIIREDVFTHNGELVYDNYVTDFEPYNVSKSQKQYANFGEIQLLAFGMKGENDAKKDKKFHKKYINARDSISSKIFDVKPILETEVFDTLSHSLLSPLLRNLTYGETALCVWIVEGYTYALVNAGKGDSSCNLLFFCRVAEPK